jgi:hypothetical protein
MHAIQAVPSSPEYPVLHLQLEAAMLAAGEFELSGQAVHARLPIIALYVPAAHSVHVSANCQKPELQVHSVEAVGEVEFALHSWQVVSATAASATE